MPDAAEAGRLLLLALDPGGTPVIVDVEPETSGLLDHGLPGDSWDARGSAHCRRGGTASTVARVA